LYVAGRFRLARHAFDGLAPDAADAKAGAEHHQTRADSGTEVHKTTGSRISNVLCLVRRHVGGNVWTRLLRERGSGKHEQSEAGKRQFAKLDHWICPFSISIKKWIAHTFF
jgi:hypothetical protein